MEVLFISGKMEVFSLQLVVLLKKFLEMIKKLSNLILWVCLRNEDVRLYLNSYKNLIRMINLLIVEWMSKE
jgi:hypothetical protein